ncbi:MAG: ribonuclease HI family protein [Candidatus Hodarchaeales archaeon]|jgi:ribonuclease HI
MDHLGKSGEHAVKQVNSKDEAEKLIEDERRKGETPSDTIIRVFKDYKKIKNAIIASSNSDNAGRNGKQEKTRIVLSFDGASRGNPGKSGAGWILEIKGKTIEGKEFLGIKTNNQAEYSGLIRGLREIKRHKPSGSVKLVIFCDSDLVVKQVTGEWAIKSRNLIDLHEEAKKLLKDYDDWRIEWVPRERNLKADQLANSAIDQEK